MRMDDTSPKPTGRSTFICTVLFIDIVGYSTQPVAQQVGMKTRFNAILSRALESSPQSEHIIVDTGDGAGIGFLGDPEDALFAATSMRDMILAEPHDSGLIVRIGINMGPIKLVRDINGQPNMIGDAINVAQRVMSFANPNQVLVSRSYFEVVSRLTREYSELFHFVGMRADKHVREHELYEVALPSAAGGGTSGSASTPSPAALAEAAAPAAAESIPVPSAAPPRQAPVTGARKTPLVLLTAAGALLLAVGVGVAVWLSVGGSGSEKRAGAQQQSIPAISFNGRVLSAQQTLEMRTIYGEAAPPGRYWYDPVSGLYGVWGRGPTGFLRAGHDFGPLSADASQGNTGVYFNGRHLNAEEMTEWQRLFGSVGGGRYWLDGRTGNVGVEGNPAPVANLLQAAKLARQKQASGGASWSSRFGFSALGKP
jgi:class 3 adenylate cyclase